MIQDSDSDFAILPQDGSILSCPVTSLSLFVKRSGTTILLSVGVNDIAILHLQLDAKSAVS